VKRPPHPLAVVFTELMAHIGYTDRPEKVQRCDFAACRMYGEADEETLPVDVKPGRGARRRSRPLQRRAH
jgi:hypothetical protein